MSLKNSFFALISRMKNITRWPLMRNTFTENVQEHSHMTAVIAHGLALIRRDIFGEDANPGEAASVALFHDASEIFTGDMPTPIKYLNRELTAAYKSAEKDAQQQLLDSLPEELRPSYKALLTEGVDPRTMELVHGADKISAYIKCLEEERGGNREFRLAAEQTLAKLQAMNLREVDYFMEHFAPAFELTLDELSRN